MQLLVLLVTAAPCSYSHTNSRVRLTLQVPKGDVLVFAGDAGIASMLQLPDFTSWLAGLPHTTKVVTFGNMDFWAASQHFSREALPAADVILIGESAEAAGFTFTGSPFTPKFAGSFQLESEDHAGAPLSMSCHCRVHLCVPAPACPPPMHARLWRLWLFCAQEDYARHLILLQSRQCPNATTMPLHVRCAAAAPLPNANHVPPTAHCHRAPRI